QQDYALVYNLREDPTPFLKMSVEELIEAWKFTRDPDAVRLPVKTLKYNRCPAVVPGVVKDEATLERLHLSREDVSRNLRLVSQNSPAFVERLFTAVKQMDEAREKDQLSLVSDQLSVDERLYDGFIDDADRQRMPVVRAAPPEQLTELIGDFKDERLKSLLPLYKARNYPRSLSEEERHEWDEFCHRKLFSGGADSRLAKYLTRLQELAAGKLTGEQQYLIEELRLYGESIAPSDESADAAG
ncbi:MAG TPA: hypothetical protein VIJ68_01015, partial [Candidatus Saccharimonadales bacterium]